MRSHTGSNRVFLLRCWQENGDLADDGRAHWRFLLEEVAPRRGRRGFATLGALLAFLRREFEEAHPPAGSRPAGGSPEEHTMSNKPVIRWEYEGKPDPLMGTGATRAEKSLVWLAGLAALAFYAVLYQTDRLDWAWWQYLVAGVIALDVGGGVVANSLNSCKRFYHAPLQAGETGLVAAAKNHWFFTALHLHPVLAWSLYGGAWGYGLLWYGLLLLGSGGVLRSPLYLRRPVAMFAVLLALLVNAYLIPAPVGFEWLMPALFLKIVYGHLVREEPYRPEV